MKSFIQFIFIGILGLNFSCSSPSDKSTTPAEDDFFDFFYENQARYVPTWQAVKKGDIIEASGETLDGLRIDFKFNVQGNLYDITTHVNSGSSPISSHFESYYYSINTIHFELVELNTANKTVDVSFFGKLYENEFDNQSNFINVQGRFKIHYTTETPAIDGLGTSAKLNGMDWHGLASGSNNYNANNSTEIEIQNDGEYIIGIVYPNTIPAMGTFSFTNTDFNNGISFAKYDLYTKAIVNYNVSGTIKYNTVNSNYVQGTFDLTATHPTIGNTITITKGTFKELLP